MNYNLLITNRIGNIPIFNAPQLEWLNLSGNHFSDRELRLDHLSGYRGSDFSEFQLSDLQIETIEPELASEMASLYWLVDIRYNAIDRNAFPTETAAAFNTMITNGLLAGGADWWKTQYTPPQVIPTNINSSSIRVDLEMSVLYARW